jgi:uncharacterized protein (DUF1697 family)
MSAIRIADRCIRRRCEAWKQGRNTAPEPEKPRRFGAMHGAPGADPLRAVTGAQTLLRCARMKAPSSAPVFVALLRAVNLGPHGKVAMADLRALMEALGLRDGKTLLQSGNLVFRGDKRPAPALEKLLQAETAKRLGVTTDFFVRTAAEWQAVIGRNPFPGEAKNDPGHLVLLVLKDPVGAAQVAALQAAIAGRELVRGHGREIYASYPDGIGRSKLTNALIEKRLGTRATGRNWNTVLKLQALAGG